MITGEANAEEWSAVSAEERATRFGQSASIIGLTGNNAKQLAYQLERKLFDTGHATTILEQGNDELAAAIKNAGLIGLRLTDAVTVNDLSFNSDEHDVDSIHAALKQAGIIH
jgi:hypothetical protein